MALNPKIVRSEKKEVGLGNFNEDARQKGMGGILEAVAQHKHGKVPLNFLVVVSQKKVEGIYKIRNKSTSLQSLIHVFK